MKKVKLIFVAADIIAFKRFKLDLIQNIKFSEDIIVYFKSNKINLENHKKLSSKLKKVKFLFYKNNFSLMQKLSKKRKYKIFINFFNHGLILALYNFLYRLDNLYLFCEGRGRFFPSHGFSLEKIIFIKNLITKIIISNYKKIIVCNDEDFLFFNSNKVLNLGPIGLNKSEYDQNLKKLNNKTQIFFIGRFLKSKGVDFFLKVFESLCIHKNTNFFMVGSFDKFNYKIKKKILKLSSFKNFKLINYTDNLPSFFNKRSILIFPSYYGEGSPRIVQECLNLSVPVLTFNSRGIKDLIENYSNGIIIENYDYDLLKFYTKKFIVDQNFFKSVNTSNRILNSIDTKTYIKKFNKFLLTNES